MPLISMQQLIFTSLAVNVITSGEKEGEENDPCSALHFQLENQLSSFAQTPLQQSGNDTVNCTTAKLNKYRHKKVLKNQIRSGVEYFRA